MSQLTPAAQQAMDKFREMYYEPAPNPRAVIHQQSMTHAIVELMNGLRLNWKDLPDECKAEVKQHMYVDESDPDNIFVSIMEPLQPRSSPKQ